jgi:hypothetical protein
MMNKTINFTFLTLAFAAMVIGVTTIITTQIVNADKEFGKQVSEIAKSQSECDSGGECLGLGDGDTEECGGDGCSSDGTGNSGKQFGKDVSNAAK